MCLWEHFGRQWVENATKYLNLKNTRIISLSGRIPDLSVEFGWGYLLHLERHVGARVPNAEWVCENRNGLTLWDATSGFTEFD